MALSRFHVGLADRRTGGRRAAFRVGTGAHAEDCYPGMPYLPCPGFLKYLKNSELESITITSPWFLNVER
jgi:hypothetical protein